MKRRVERPRRIATLVAVLALGGATYAAFGPGLPGRGGFELRGVFATSNQLRAGSDVRIAGMTIGQVERIRTTGNGAALVTMRIDDDTVAIRSDARLAIAPRLALEGNYYVDVRPGSPSAPQARSGATVPLSRTSGPVQLDQFLNTFTLPTRNALTASIDQLSEGLGKGKEGDGTAGLRDAVRELDGALGSIGVVAKAVQGTRQGDLRRAVGSTGDVTAQLGRSPSALAATVTNFDRTFAAFSDERLPLAESVRELDAVLRDAPAQFRAINRALPSLSALARAARPALDRAPAALTDTNRMLTQIAGATQERELPTLLRRLAPVTATLPALQTRLGGLFPYVSDVMDCISKNVVPTLNDTITDGRNSTGQPVWLEFLHMGANLTSAAGGSDANGTTVRIGVSQSESALRAVVPGFGELIANADIEGVAPYGLGTGVEPENRPDQRCVDQPLPDLNARRAPAIKPTTTMSSLVKRGEPEALAAVRTALLTKKRSALLDALTRLLRVQGFSGKTINTLLGRVLARSPATAPAPAPKKTPTIPLAPRPPATAATPPSKPVDIVKDVVGKIVGPKASDDVLQGLTQVNGRGGRP